MRLRGLIVILLVLASLARPGSPPTAAIPRATNTPAPTWTPGPTVTPAPAWDPYPAPSGKAAPAPPMPTWQLDGSLQVTFAGGTLHEALCHRPGCAAPLICRMSPCTPPGIGPGAALIVIGPTGESLAVLVPPRVRWGYLPIVLR